MGAALQGRRESLGLPRAELARRIRVTPTYVWMVERARRRKNGDPSRPAELLLQRWAQALGMDQRYTHQVLLLAGYGEGRSDESGVAARPSVQPGPMGRARAMAPRSVPSTTAQVMASSAPDDAGALFLSAPVTFPQPRSLQREVLVEEARSLLDGAEETDRWDETVDLLESYLQWLHYRLEIRDREP